MSKQEVVEIRSNDPIMNACIAIADDLVKRGIPFVCVPCVTPEQADAATALGKKHYDEILQLLPTSH
ncbi:hypothetical protein CASP1_00022 [Alcaligenes phage CASP1]|nr:hypothetical protein CASP1_00022 [Alcaligenes phage CASP1]